MWEYFKNLQKIYHKQITNANQINQLRKLQLNTHS